LVSTSRFSSINVGIICGTGAALFYAAGYAATRHGLDVGFSPADLTIHRYLWFGLVMLPSVLRTGMGDLNGVGWGRGILLAVLGGPVFSIISFAGLLLVPLGHGGVIQPACAALPPKAGIHGRVWNVCKVPIADIHAPIRSPHRHELVRTMEL
jgi:drug/metabolite transporter (DMT)-like permease